MIFVCFLVIFVIIIIKMTIIIIIATIIIITGTFFLSYAQNVVLTSGKKGPSCPNWGQGEGGLGESGNAQKKTFFFVFPNVHVALHWLFNTFWGKTDFFPVNMLTDRGGLHTDKFSHSSFFLLPLLPYRSFWYQRWTTLQLQMNVSDLTFDISNIFFGTKLRIAIVAGQCGDKIGGNWEWSAGNKRGLTDSSYCPATDSSYWLPHIANQTCYNSSCSALNVTIVAKKCANETNQPLLFNNA